MVANATVRAIALAMAVAAEPAWTSGQWVALLGSLGLVFFAAGASPAEIVRFVRLLRQ